MDRLGRGIFELGHDEETAVAGNVVLLLAGNEDAVRLEQRLRFSGRKSGPVHGDRSGHQIGVGRHEVQFFAVRPPAR